MSTASHRESKRVRGRCSTAWLLACLCFSVSLTSSVRAGDVATEAIDSQSGGVAAGNGFYDGFESYPLGAFCEGGGWEVWIGGGDGVCGEIVDGPARDGQSLRIGTEDDMVHRLDISEGTQELRVWTYMPLDATGRGFVGILAEYPEPLGLALSVAFDAGDDLVYDFFDPRRNTPIVKGRWVELRVVANLSRNDVDAWYNDTQFIAGRLWRECTTCGPVESIRALNFYGAQIGATGFFFDDVSLEMPECARDPEWVCDGDVDGDGQVNPVDAGLVQASFGSTDEQAVCNYDMDCDGHINPVDAGIVQSLFGTCAAPRNACP